MLQAVLVEALQLGPAVLEQLPLAPLDLAGHTVAARAVGGDGDAADAAGPRDGGHSLRVSHSRSLRPPWPAVTRPRGRCHVLRSRKVPVSPSPCRPFLT